MFSGNTASACICSAYPFFKANEDKRLHELLFLDLLFRQGSANCCDSCNASRQGANIDAWISELARVGHSSLNRVN